MLKKYLRFDFKLSFFLIVTFIIMTVIGTMTHELGHYSVAKFLGYQSTINYKSAHYDNQEFNVYFNNLAKKYGHEIKNNLAFPEKENYLKTLKNIYQMNFG